MADKKDPYELSPKTRRLVIFGAIAVVIAVGVYIGFSYKDNFIARDSCVRVEGDTLVNQKIVEIDCGLPDAALKIALVSDYECPDGDYTSALGQTRDGEWFTSNVWTCFVLNGDVGDCFLPLGSVEDIRKIACSEPKAYRVNQKIDGVYEQHKSGEPEPAGSRCGDDTSISYSEPAVTLCLGKVAT